MFSHLCLDAHNHHLSPCFLCPCAWASGVTPSCTGDIAYRASLFRGIVVEGSLLCPCPYVGGAASVGMTEDAACVHSRLHHLHK